ncbi:dual specificity protein phosphatase 10-like [Panonychus citri]|uniref:dual specificity protein phosphatase 10-like n=1 Tax=Panonychus citri TaxID=50023 RepID=UPI002307AAFF|nr:dual specificity protein phosphatase 10-like [Panonychus citri]
MVPCGTLILPYLYLGDQSDASDPERLKCHNIYYVLNVTADLPGEGENHSIHYKRIPARDSFDQNLVQYFEESFKFIEEARQSGRAVLIHCHAGISRSPTIVIAYLMFSKKMNFDDAFKFVADKRPKISPNFSFVGQLCEYEKTQLRPATTITLIPPSSTATTPSPPPPVPFKAPGVPFVPALAIVINIYLIFRLSILTLVRFSIWMTIDFIMIFGYGIKNSSLEKDPYPRKLVVTTIQKLK